MTDARTHAGLGRSGVPMIMAGIGSIVALFVLYARYVSEPGSITPEAVDALHRIAYAFYALVAAAFGAVAYGLYRYHMYAARSQSMGLVATIARHTQNRRSRSVFATVFVVYGIFFSLTSGTLVYQPEVVFSYHYGVQVPSIDIIACCDAPGYMPKILTYITEHVGLQIIPINLVLQITVSYLVALNASVAVRALNMSRTRRTLSGVGAITGLFIACPTCVGSVTSLLIGTASGITLSVALVQFQTGLIAVSIPILLATPFLLAKKLPGLHGACATDRVR